MITHDSSFAWTILINFKVSALAKCIWKPACCHVKWALKVLTSCYYWAPLICYLVLVACHNQCRCLANKHWLVAWTSHFHWLANSEMASLTNCVNTEWHIYNKNDLLLFNDFPFRGSCTVFNNSFIELSNKMRNKKESHSITFMFVYQLHEKHFGSLQWHLSLYCIPVTLC